MTGRDAPFFIVGAGRSGTTLLRLMLAGHSRLHIPAETWFMTELVQRLPLLGTLTAAQVDTALAIITGHPRWPDAQFPADALRRQARSLQSPTLAELIALLFTHQRGLSGKRRIGEKTPHYFAIVPQLAAMFPDARFIHLVRDGRDVAMSWIDAGWNRYHERNFEWVRAMEARRAWRETKLQNRVLEIRYEALVRQPEATLRTVCAFLGEAYEPAMLRWDDRLSLLALRDRHLHGKLAGPLSTGSADTWRTLPGWQGFAMESCLRRHLLELGYKLRFRRPLWRPLLLAVGGLLRVASPLLSRVVPWCQRRGWLRRQAYI